jgi:hypothetical protein
VGKWERPVWRALAGSGDSKMSILFLVLSRCHQGVAVGLLLVNFGTLSRQRNVPRHMTSLIRGLISRINTCPRRLARFSAHLLAIVCLILCVCIVTVDCLLPVTIPNILESRRALNRP